MVPQITRRTFLSASAGAAALAAGLGREAFAQPSFKRTLKKAVIVGKPTEQNLRPIKDAGFDGVEAGIVTAAEAEEARKTAEGMGLRIHSVLRGWAQFNSDNPQEVQSSFDQTVRAIEAAHGYGADAVLLVTCRIGGMPMPEAWDFRLKFDKKTGHLTQVAEGDNTRYQAYMDAHNKAYDRSAEQVQKLIPIAKDAKVVLAIENVWNNLFAAPEHLACFTDSFKSPWVKIYFDLGNHVKYGPTEQWVKVLGKRIAKCHVKDFKLNADGHGGNFVDVRDGSINWPVVRKALDDIGYDGWMTIEGGAGGPLPEQNRRLDLICQGK